MKCYIANGRLYRTKHEAPKGAKPFTFPDDQQGKIDLVNRVLDQGSIERPSRPAARQLEEGEETFRVYVKGQFACRIAGSSPSEARERAIEQIDITH